MVNISNIGVISPLGCGVAATIASYAGGECGVCPRPSRHIPSLGGLPVGEVAPDNAELMRELFPGDAEAPVSRTALLALNAVGQIVKEAGDALGRTPKERVALITSTTVGGMDLTPVYYKALMNGEELPHAGYITNHPSAAHLGHLLRRFPVAGYSTVLSTACSSSSNAIALGAQLIESGFVDLAICGGTDALCEYTVRGFQSLAIYDTAPCRPMTAARNGLNLGEAAAYLLLSAPGKVAGLKQVALLKGYANACDAHHQTAISPDATGPALSMRSALAKADLRPEDINRIHCHGTGTPNNDARECQAIEAVFGAKKPQLVATKTYTGHTLAAAGALDAALTILRAEAGETVMCNSFGFGGNCTSLIIEKANC